MLHQNISCGYSKEPSQWDGSFDYLKQMLKWIVKKKYYNFTLKCMVKYSQSCGERIHAHTGDKPFDLFDLILYVPSTIFQLNRDGSSWVEPVLSKIKCVLLKDHKVVTPVRIEPAAPPSLVKHSTTEPLPSIKKNKKHLNVMFNTKGNWKSRFIIHIDCNLFLHTSAFGHLWNVRFFKILWKMEHLLLSSICSIFHNIFKTIEM